MKDCKPVVRVHASQISEPRSGHDTRVKCAFCPGSWETRVNGLIHTMPPCQEFNEMGIVEFMQKTREIYGIPDMESDA